MAESKNWYLICYDIRSPKRWRKAYKLLQGYGEAVQYSIFRSRLNQREREKLRWELAKILASEDNLLIVGLCHRCVERVHQCNCPGVWAESGEGYRVL
ncbi:CRISPR-associated endonuclease Cas2 [Leptolyngbya sp. GGD]|uniref:CRISPR-associated endonuclease Cas2 n=1 Tax=Leptolyngbya sp. GGD TaxID=2997907 RepID=UPI00227C9CF9|nr:CRISPR-associated endonuclease Cas2 [Leptolyngbya sp. GGD]MCY6492310.1 CRISPR-associated endonuclease Cas2 [Leptolyngbya sp. GGD]